MSLRWPTLDDVAAAKKGDRRAIDKVVRGMEGLVQWTTRRYAGMSELSLDDLRQEARISILSAIRKFDPEKSPNWVAYCHRWIRALASRSALQQQGGHRFKGRLVSIDGEPALENALHDEAELADQSLSEFDEWTKVVEVSETVLHGEARLVFRRRRRGQTLDAIGTAMGLSRERVRQLEVLSLATMRTAVARRGIR